MTETTEALGRRRRAIRMVLATFAALTVIVPVTASRADAGFRRGEQARGTQTPLLAGPSTGRSTQVGSSAQPRDARSANIVVTYTGFQHRGAERLPGGGEHLVKRRSPRASRSASRRPSRTSATPQESLVRLADHGAPQLQRQQDRTRGTRRRSPTRSPAPTSTRPPQTSRPASTALFPNGRSAPGGPGPSNTYDFETVVLHEIGHGLGFLLSFRQSGTQIIHGFTRWRRVLAVHRGHRVLTDNQGQLANCFPSGSTNFKNAVTSNNLFGTEYRGKQANNGNRPKLFAPNPFQPGSSAVAPERGHVPAGERETR